MTAVARVCALEPAFGQANADVVARRQLFYRSDQLVALADGCETARQRSRRVESVQRAQLQRNLVPCQHKAPPHRRLEIFLQSRQAVVSQLQSDPGIVLQQPRLAQAQAMPLFQQVRLLLLQ